MILKAMFSLMGLLNLAPDVLDDFEVPDNIDRAALLDTIIIDTADFELLYPEPTVLRTAIRVWSHARAPIWRKMQDTTTLKYNPIENYDRHEKIVDESVRGGKDTSTVSQTGYDGDEPQLAEIQTSTPGSTLTNVHEAYIHGNIGVTSSQDMLKQERDIVDYDVISKISREFCEKFTLMLY